MIKPEELKEKKFDYSSFIGAWFLPSSLCDELIDYYEYNRKYCAQGLSKDNEGISRVIKEDKDSFDLCVGSLNFDNVIGVYREKLQIVLEHYVERYEHSDKVMPYNIKENLNIQKYPIGGGFKKWHKENAGGVGDIRRHLVFMTYLNNVPDGGTEFFHQKITTRAEKGLTLIWPATWTHVHRGIISKTTEKYIITGWYSFKE